MMILSQISPADFCELTFVKFSRQAWQKLGAMPPEEAMQMYISIITDLYPSWASGSTSVSSLFYFVASCLHCSYVHLLTIPFLFELDIFNKLVKEDKGWR